MTTNRFINPRPQYLLSDGSVMPNGKMNFYENGTLIRKDTFSDVNEDNKNENPLPLNADGSMPNAFYAGTARTILTFDDGSGQQQRFDVNGVGTFGSGAAFDIFNSITEYEDGALVEASDGEYYRSLQNNNTGNDPVSSPTFWEQVSFLRTYNANITYALGDGGVVASDGKIYVSLQAANLNNDPTSSPTFWAVNNPFDQDLNKDDNAEFDNLTLKGIANVGGNETNNFTAYKARGSAPAVNTFIDINLACGDGSGGFPNRTVILRAQNGTGGIDQTNFIVLTADTGAPVEGFRITNDQKAIFAGNINAVAGGINLGATGAANLLDDFEKGTFTPTVIFSAGSGTITYTTQVGTYTKVGDIVHYQIQVVLLSLASRTGDVSIGGLPFTSSAGFAIANTILGSAQLTAGQVATGRLDPSGTSILMRIWDIIQGTSNLQDTKIDDNTEFLISGSYKT